MKVKGTLEIADEAEEHHFYVGKRDKHFLIKFTLDNGKVLFIDSCRNCELVYVDDESLEEAGLI